MTLADLITYTTSKLGLTDATAQAQAQRFAQARWRMIWNQANWRAARWQDTVTVAAGTQDVTLPEEFELVTAARWAGETELLAIDDVSALAQNPAGYDASGPVVAFIPLGKDSSGNARIRLMQTPATEQALLVIGKRKCIELENPSDTPLIAGADQVLCELVMGDLYEWLRQMTKAQAFFQKAAALTQAMIDLEMQQTSEIRRLVPVVPQLETEF